MGAKSRQKGKRGEREIVALARELGLDAGRTWQTAQAPDATARNCDVLVEGESYQCQVEADGFRRLYRELEGVAGFFCRADRRPWLAVFEARRLFGLLRETRELRAALAMLLHGLGSLEESARLAAQPRVADQIHQLAANAIVRAKQAGHKEHTAQARDSPPY